MSTGAESEPPCKIDVDFDNQRADRSRFGANGGFTGTSIPVDINLIGIVPELEDEEEAVVDIFI